MDFKSILSRNSDTLMQLGRGLLEGKTASEQLSSGLGGALDGRRANKTLDYLRQNNPDIADMMATGVIDGSTAVKLAWDQKLQAQKPKTYDMQTLPNGDYGTWDETTGTFNKIGNAAKPMAQGPAQFKMVSPEEAPQYGLPAGHYQINTTTNEVRPLKVDDPNAPAVLTPTDKKAMWAAEDEIPVYDNAISALNRAKELNNKTFTGTTASVRGWLGSKVPGGDYLVDNEAAKATVEFNNLMSEQAIANMSQALKGATTDQELAQFKEILADPSTDPEIRNRTIDRMLQLAEQQKQVKIQRIQSISGPGAAQPARQGAGRTNSGISFTVEP